jgi:hypothetical protein
MRVAKPAANRVRLREQIRERCKDLTPHGVLAALYAVYGWGCFKGTALMLIFGHQLIPGAPILVPPTQLRGWPFAVIALACWLVASVTGVFVGWHVGKGVEFIAETRPNLAYPLLISSVLLPFAIVFVPVFILPGEQKLAMGVLGITAAILVAGLVCLGFHWNGWPERPPRG